MIQKKNKPYRSGLKIEGLSEEPCFPSFPQACPHEGGGRESSHSHRQISNQTGIICRKTPSNEAANLFKGIKSCILNHSIPVQFEFCSPIRHPRGSEDPDKTEKLKHDQYNVAFISYFCYNNQTTQTKASVEKTIKG